MNEALLNGSDKQYWHRFLPLYEKELGKVNEVKKILEFGVFKGDSIRWLKNKYPKANIFGGDILPVQNEWPLSPFVEYIRVDQGDINGIERLFQKVGKDIDLLIEDGSHFPEHQKNCLILGIEHMSSGGLYILEDLHTSHPEHPYYKNTLFEFLSKEKIRILKLLKIIFWGSRIYSFLLEKLTRGQKFIGCLHLLLCFEHLKKIGKDLDENLLLDLSSKSLFTPKEIETIFNKIDSIKIYKRSTLPHKCYVCGSVNYNFHLLKCSCGVDIYSNSDSMAAIIRIS
jgi:hypothetical protein